jgi:hypothetical protein
MAVKQKTHQEKLLKALRKLEKRNRQLLRTGKVKVQQPEHGHYADRRFQEKGLPVGAPKALEAPLWVKKKAR